MESKKTLLFIFGTRPEAIKMAPLIRKFLDEQYNVKICVTGQHKEMLQQVMDIFKLNADYNLNIMKENQSLSDITASILTQLVDIYENNKIDLIFVHGDTSTTLGASLSAFYHKIPVAHIEAGLRTGNVYNPWPEEINRQLVSRIATYHFAPTETSVKNLKNENIINNVVLSGNTVIDSLYFILSKINSDPSFERNIKSKIQLFINEKTDFWIKKFILVTMHRRENLGFNLRRICLAIQEIAYMYPDVNIVYPVHLNPQVQATVHEILDDVPNIFLLPPLLYTEFLYIMSKAYFILTDSGGIQEEAPSLGVPVLVARTTTERPEAVDAGTVKLIGVEKSEIIYHCNLLLSNDNIYLQMKQSINPYGDGNACDKIVAFINKFYK